MNSTAVAAATIPNYSTGSPPTTPVAGSFWFDSTAKQLKFYDGTSTNTVGNTSTLPASAITSGTMAAARLGSGTANSTTYLRGDNSWAALQTSQWTTTGSDIYYSAGNVGIGTAAPSGTLDVQGGTNATGGGIPINFTAQNAAAGTSNFGGSINLTAGNSTAVTSGAKRGGDITLTAGMGAWVSGGTNNGRGGIATIQGGQGAPTSVGGIAVVKGGSAGATSGTGGPVQILGGTTTEGIGGAVTINGSSAATATAANYNGGAVSISGGTSVNAGTGGAVTITGGFGNGTANTGGVVNLSGGSDMSAAGIGHIVLQQFGGNVGISNAAPSKLLHVGSASVGVQSTRSSKGCS